MAGIKDRKHSINAASKLLDVSADRIKTAVAEGKISLQAGMVTSEVLEKILSQKKKYIGFCGYAMLHESESFNPGLCRYREKLLDALEVNGFFGVEIIETVEILCTERKDEPFYFFRRDIEFLDEKLDGFFADYGLSAEERTKNILTNTKGHAISKKYIRKYWKEFMGDESISPSFYVFVKLLMESTDLMEMKDEDVLEMLEKAETVRTKQYLVSFLNYAKKRARAGYCEIRAKKKDSREIPAYSLEAYIGFSRYLFHEDTIKANGIVKKALDHSLYAEMWLYISAHYICGWRSGDICRAWCYPELYRKAEGFMGIDKERLYEDILMERISEERYAEICSYTVKSVELAKNAPSKTADFNPGDLRINISRTLKPFFGRMILIAENHRLHSDEGYMAVERAKTYKSRQAIGDFLGKEAADIMGGRNLASRRMNKSYLQMIEDVARRMGHEGMTASAVASYARNHRDLNTVVTYLKDHNLTGEDSGMVLYFMLERGIFGFSIYRTFLAAYPDSMRKLTMKQQTELIKGAGIPAYQIELSGSGELAGEELMAGFGQGKKKDAARMLKAMFAIGQGHGKAKDEGVYCIKRALGQVCENPKYNSCLAEMCRYHVFTRNGIKPLLYVIREYRDKAAGGDVKAKNVLKKVIVPNFQEILNEIMAEMTKQERNNLKNLIGEELDR